MHGNVWEWCEDDWHENYENAPTDGSAWLSGKSSDKVLRGGSWSFNPVICRSAFRYDFSRVDRFDAVGFRVVYVALKTTQSFALLLFCTLLGKFGLLYYK